MTVNIVDYGARTQNSDNAEYIQRAIDDLTDGGTLVIPGGEFVTGGLKLRSDICIMLEAGAVLKAHTDISKYMMNGYFDSFGNETNSLVIAKNCKNITFCGNGIIDLSGKSFVDFEPHGEQLNMSDEDFCQMPAIPYDRPRRPILFDECTNITIKDITVLDAPCWTFTLHNCDEIFVSGINVKNNPRIPHNDGIHLTACRNAIITDCSFVCGDDCIAITSLFDYSIVTENIVISNCIMSSRSAALRIGHIASKVKNITVNNLIIKDTNRGIAIFSGDDGSVENVRITNVIAHTRLFKGDWWGKGEPFVLCTYNSTGKIKNISINSMTAFCDNSGVVAGNNIENVSFESVLLNVDFSKFKDDKYELCPNGFADRAEKQDDIVYLN